MAGRGRRRGGQGSGGVAVVGSLRLRAGVTNDGTPLSPDTFVFPKSISLDGFRFTGRGVVVTFDNGDEVRYSTIENLRGALTDAPELEGLLGVAGNAVASYDPETEAVVIDSRHEGISLYVVRADGVETLGTLAFVAPT